eukprot:scaffold442_cov397-Prasinococcus_capsulatus_cf.AAC.44
MVRVFVTHASQPPVGVTGPRNVAARVSHTGACVRACLRTIVVKPVPVQRRARYPSARHAEPSSRASDAATAEQRVHRGAAPRIRLPPRRCGAWSDLLGSCACVHQWRLAWGSWRSLTGRARACALVRQGHLRLALRDAHSSHYNCRAGNLLGLHTDAPASCPLALKHLDCSSWSVCPQLRWRAAW